MKSYFKEIENKLSKQIKFEKFEIVDNSEMHKRHKFFNPEKLHLHLKIKSTSLKTISRIQAHKMIMSILKDDLKSKIHALEISLE
tara:strand:- start:68 stop:322 length:255 start_codon:yes stop_codon:yes gene_type:complete